MEKASAYFFQKIKTPDWKLLQSFCDTEPAWENNETAIKKNIHQYLFYGIKNKNAFTENQNGWIAFVIIKKENGYIPLFGVHPDYRKQGVGQLLFFHLSSLYPILKINNVAATAIPLLNFLEKVGLRKTISQYEMVSYL